MTNLKDYVKEHVLGGIRDDSWISNKREKISLDNSALFKAKDVQFLDEVRDYLGGTTLDLQLCGSAIMNAINGEPRVYSDIDLLASTKGLVNIGIKDAVLGLVHASNGVKPIEGWEVEDITPAVFHRSYMGDELGYRFRITSPKTKTTIDVGFQAKIKPIERTKITTSFDLQDNYNDFGNGDFVTFRKDE
jgi:hypothetical protein